MLNFNLYRKYTFNITVKRNTDKKAKKLDSAIFNVLLNRRSLKFIFISWQLNIYYCLQVKKLKK